MAQIRNKVKIRIVALAVAVMTMTATCAVADIVGSKHDFSAMGWSEGQVCLVCHTPHNANQTVATAPLWNHKITEVTNYTLYDSDSMNQTPGQPGGISKLCLSCHDGTVALDSIGTTTGSTKVLPGQPGYIGTDLSDDHPVSVTWDHQTIWPFWTSPKCFACHDFFAGDGNPEKFRVPFYTYDGGSTYKVECSSCHDPHNNGDGTQGPDYMLRTKIDDSYLCLLCHNR